MKVLITGATGFIGRVLHRALIARGHVVEGTTRLPTAGFHPCDLCDDNAVIDVIQKVKPEAVVHMAAVATVTNGCTMDYYATNVVGTENLLNALSAFPQPVRFLFMSTAGVYGNHPVERLAEHLPPLPVHHYGLSKLAAEQVVRNLAGSMDFTIVRPFNVVGAGQNDSFIVPKLVGAFARNERSIRLGNIDVYRDYMDVDLACEILCDLLECQASFGETVNLCTGQSTSLRDLIEIMQDIAGYQIEVFQAPEFMRKSEIWKLLGSQEKLESLLKRRIETRPLSDVLCSMVEFHRSRLGVCQ